MDGSFRLRAASCVTTSSLLIVSQKLSCVILYHHPPSSMLYVCFVQGMVVAAKYIRDKIENEKLLIDAFNPVVIVCCRCVSL